jgi:hypothetical protein
MHRVGGERRRRMMEGRFIEPCSGFQFFVSIYGNSFASFLLPAEISFIFSAFYGSAFYTTRKKYFCNDSRAVVGQSKAWF